MKKAYICIVKGFGEGTFVPSFYLIKEVQDLIRSLIEELLQKKFQEPEFEDCFLIEIIDKGKKIQVFIDRDEGIDFATCSKVSRYLESHLDENGSVPEDYILEVSSPGAGRPLVSTRQYPRNIGRQLKLKLADGSRVRGRLVAVHDDRIELKEKKKKKTKPGLREIPFEEIAEAKVIVSFKR